MSSSDEEVEHGDEFSDSNTDSTKDDGPGSFANFPLSEETIAKLHERGVSRLFPVQYKTFNEIRAGMNVVAQAHTGTGKTFAFAIPIVETLQASKKIMQLKHGRQPSVLVLAPTRELAKQIATDFTAVISTNLRVLPVYGGVAYEKHTGPLSKGVDIVVGAPGRVKDLMEQGHLSLKRTRFVVLDEVDRMLDMGFRDDVDLILTTLYPEVATSGKKKRKVPQTLLFSATLPPWVEEISRRYLNPGGQGEREIHRICLTGDTENPMANTDNKTASTVEHFALQCPWQERPTAISDVIRCYCSGPDSRCIVFCERKKDADELAAHSSMSTDCHVLHGDIPQEKRELVLEKFRSGKYRVLVTTNVAARGLDIPAVDLVIQCRPPSDVEDYIHRSGRTGRAGRSGRCICFYTMKEREELQRVEASAGIRFSRINCPTAQDIVRSSEKDTISSLAAIPEATWQVFQDSARSAIEELGAERAMSCALAKLCGKVEVLKTRSLLTTREGFTAYYLKTAREDEIRSKGYAYRALERCLEQKISEQISHLMFTKDRMGFVFDLPSSVDEEVKSFWQDGKFDALEVMTELPELCEEEKYAGSGMGRGSYSSGGRGRGGFERGRGSFRGSFQRSFDRNGDGNNEGRGRGRGGRGGFSRGSFSNSSFNKSDDGEQSAGDNSFGSNRGGRGRGRGSWGNKSFDSEGGGRGFHRGSNFSRGKRGGGDFGNKRPYNGESEEPETKTARVSDD